MSVENLQTSNSPVPPRNRVLIVGGSTRAAAWSALRAGFQPICADLFADVDTRQVAEIVPVRSYPDSLPDDVADVVADGWFYTGALENRPDLIQKLSRPGARYGPLWGASDASLRLIRDPFWIAEQLRQNRAPALDLQPRSQPPSGDGTWMLKPFASAGGINVCAWDRQRQFLPIPEEVYFQRRAEGMHLSALYTCDGAKTCDGAITFHGFTRHQLFHGLSGAASPFLYSGSIGPLGDVTTSPEALDRLERDLTSRAAILARESGLNGIFGIDFILDEHGTPWILEVNPRYTASVELIELAHRRSLLPFSGQSKNIAPPSQPRPHVSVIAKTILYTSHSLVAPDLRTSLHTTPRSNDPWAIPDLADVPVPGSTIEANWPICTVLSEGKTQSECLRQLHDRVDTVREMVNHRRLGR